MASPPPAVDPPSDPPNTTAGDPPRPLPQDGSGAMFDAIAERYDLLNRLISLGVDQGWRKRTVAALEVSGPARVLDLATGTADLAVLVARSHPQCRVLGVDPSPKMLAIGQRKVSAAGLSQRIELTEGDAQALSAADASFDGVTMAFGIRNVPDRPRALSEMRRVTRSSGRVAILELSEPRSGPLAALARFHMHRVVPWLGGVLSGRGAYRYLPDSIAAFPSAGLFVEMMRAAGFRDVVATPLTFGVCHLYVGRAP